MSHPVYDALLKFEIICYVIAKSIYNVEGVRYPENDDALTNWVTELVPEKTFWEGSVLILSLTIFLL